MKTNNNKGFTLIELIMVIVILGILAAVAVPKFFDVTAQAKTKSKQAVIGNIKAGLNLYAANQIVTNGERAFPDGDNFLLSSVMDEVPDGWTAVDSSVANFTRIYYNKTESDEAVYIYESDPALTGASATFSLTAE